jgi:hypothetical protein
MRYLVEAATTFVVTFPVWALLGHGARRAGYQMTLGLFVTLCASAFLAILAATYLKERRAKDRSVPPTRSR